MPTPRRSTRKSTPLARAGAGAPSFERPAQPFHPSSFTVTLPEPRHRVDAEPPLRWLRHRTVSPGAKTAARGLAGANRNFREMTIYCNGMCSAACSDHEMSAQTPISIALPVFNGERYVAQAIRSILDQTWPDFELIISDNASTDGTEDICRSFVAQDQRIRYVRQPRNIGASPNFNVCFALASGQYFKWAAHDDYLEPDYLAACARALDANPDAVLAHSLVRLVDHRDRLIEVFRPIEPEATSPRPSERFAARIRNPRCLEIWGVMRTSALRNSVLIGSYIGMDRALLLELALRGRFVLIDQPLFVNRDHPERATRVTRTRTRLDLAAVYDTANAGQTVLSTWMYYKDAVRIILRNLEGSAERLRCFGYLLQSLGRTWNLVFLVTEPLMGLTPNVHTGAKSLRRSLRRAKQRFLGQT